MRKVFGVAILIIGLSAIAMAGGIGTGGGSVSVPEIDPTTAASALGLLAGVALVIRGRRK